MQIVLRRDFSFPGPLLETPKYWIVHGFDEDLNVATRNASMDMLGLLNEHMGLSRNDAYSLMSVASDYANSMLHVWDGDGLWVGNLLENPDLKAAPARAYTLCGENFGNTLYEVPAGSTVPGLAPGDVLLFGGGQNNTPVYRITGWNTMHRQHGALTITPAQAAGLTAAVQAERTQSGVAHLPYLRRDAVKLDGVLDEWKGVTPLEIRDGNTVRAKVYLAWNNGGLVAAFDVTTDTPWASASSPTLAFQGGAAVDMSYGPLDPARTVAGPGDVRVVASPAGDGAAEEFLPLLAPDMPDSQRAPVTYQTGQGNITFARVASLGKGTVAMHPRPGGYVVEMAVPVRAPLLLHPGARFRLDASVILATPDGKASAIRLPWHAHATDDMTAYDTYLESLLRPAHWGEAVLE